MVDPTGRPLAHDLGFEPQSQVAVGRGFSDRGFAVVPDAGDILADLVIVGRTAPDLELFRLDRPACGAGR